MRFSKPLLGLACAVSLTWACYSAQAYQEIEVSDGGSIHGKVVFNGRVPMKTIIPTKDAAVCGDKREEPQVLVGADNGVQDAIVYLDKLEKGKAWGKPTATPSIDNKDCRFHPTVQVIPEGPIEIVNSDPVLHNTHGYYGRRTAFNIALPEQGLRVEKQLNRPGLVKVDCDAHGWMLGHVYVADNPYYAVTAADGTFTITDIPPGQYSLVVWQVYTGSTDTAVTVEASKATEISIELKK